MYFDFEGLRWRRWEVSQEEIQSRSDWRRDMSEWERIGRNRKISSAYRMNWVEVERVRSVRPLM